MKSLDCDINLINSLRVYLTENVEFYLSLLKRLVDINSFSLNPLGVNKVGQEVIKIFDPLNMNVTEHQSKSKKYGTYLTFTSSTDASCPILALVSHMDTVFSEEEEKKNDFSWKREKDKQYGPGVIDNKGGIIMIYALLDCIRQFFPDIYKKTNWGVFLNSAEELGTEEFIEICKDYLEDKVIACLIFEPGSSEIVNQSIVTSRKGIVSFKVEVEGRAAHAGNNHKAGVNAINQLCNIILAISELTNYDKEITFNIGSIHGGETINQVPHYAYALGEMRAFSLEEFDEGINKLLSLKYRTLESFDKEYSSKVNIEVTSRTNPWPHNVGTEQLSNYWKEAGRLLNIDVSMDCKAGLSDGNFLWNLVPTIDGLGPSGGNAHSSQLGFGNTSGQEFLDVNQLVNKMLLNTLAIVQLLAHKV